MIKLTTDICSLHAKNICLKRKNTLFFVLGSMFGCLKEQQAQKVLRQDNFLSWPPKSLN